MSPKTFARTVHIVIGGRGGLAIRRTQPGPPVRSLRLLAVLGTTLLMCTFVLAGQSEAQPTSARAYIANSVSGSVSVIDIASRATVSTIPVNQPNFIAAAPGGRTIYVTTDVGIAVLDTSTNAVAHTIPLPFGVQGLAVSPDGSRVYAIASDAKALLVIDPESRQLIATVVVGERPIAVTVRPDGARIYIAHQGLGPNGTGDNAVTVVDADTNSVITDIPLGDMESTGIAVSPDGARVYVSNVVRGSTDARISVINTLANTVDLSIPMGSVPFALKVTPDGSKLYVTHSFDDRVSVVATASNSIVGSIAVGRAPQGAAITPDGNSLLVTNVVGDSVSVIDVATDVVTSTVSTGQAPSSIAIALVPTSVTASSNLAGLAAYPAVGQTFNHIDGSWTEPDVSCQSPARSIADAGQQARVSSWIGLGGIKAGAPLVQIGTIAACVAGVIPVHTTFYQIFPFEGPNFGIQFRVAPKDVMSARIDYSEGKSTYTLVLENLTRGWKWTTTRKAEGNVRKIAGADTRSSAEWIVERPAQDRRIGGCAGAYRPLAKFSPVFFNGSTGSINKYDLFKIVGSGTSENGVTLAEPGASSVNLSTGSIGVEVDWRALGCGLSNLSGS